MNISSFVLGSAGSYTTAASINNLANSATNSSKWCVYLIHSIDVNNDYSPLSSTVLQASVNYLSTNQNKFWVETFGNVVCYIKERNAASVAETANSGDSITIQVTDGLNDSIYNYPITLRRPMPANWPGAVVLQNNKPIATQLVTVGSTNFVMFDVVPDGGDVTLSKLTSPVLSNLVLTALTNLTFRLDGQGGVRYAIYSSGDLVNWAPVQTNILAGTYTNFTVTASNALQFYHAKWVP